MRALKTILIILLAIGALIVVLGLIGPKTVTVERSTTIAAPASTVFPKVASLRTMHDWSPWKAMEPGQKTEFTGTDGEIGSTQSWEGDTVGSGNMKVIEIEKDKHVGLDLNFVEPMESHSKVDLDLAPAGDSTKVTWRMTSENGFMGRVMCVFMNMDKMVGPDFEKGLANLKTMAEADQAAMAEKAKMFGGFEVTNMEQPAKTIVGVRKKIKWSEMHDFFSKSFAAAGEAVGKAGVTPGMPSGVYFVWDEKNQMTEVLAGFQVPADAKDKVKGMDKYDAPAGAAYQIVYTGGYNGSGKAHEAMAEKMKADNAQQGEFVLEEYVTGPAQEPDSNKWVTNIIYPVKK